MSQRYKRQSSRPDEGPVTKRRKGRPVGVGSSKSHAVLEDDEATSSAMESVHSSRGGGSYSDLKAMNTIYNRNTTEAPAEVSLKKSNSTKFFKNNFVTHSTLSCNV